MSQNFVLTHIIVANTCNANNFLITSILMSSVSSNLLHCGVDLILGNNIKSDGDKSCEYGGGGHLILESLVLPKTALLKFQCEVLRCRATVPTSSFLKLRSYYTNSLNQTGKYFHIVFLIQPPLCLVVRVPDYRSRGSGFDSRRY
jgi:hypothetical protein